MKNIITALVGLVAALIPAQAASLFTERVYDFGEVVSAVRVIANCDTKVSSFGPYAEVRYDSIPKLREDFLRFLSGQGIPVSVIRGKSGASERFNCTAFVNSFLGYTQGRLMRELFQSESKAVRPAIFTVYYHVNGETDKMHAIVLMLTDKGAKWQDPQTLTESHLSDIEVKNISFVMY